MAEKIIRINRSLALVVCMLLCVMSSSAWAVVAPDAPAIYSAALDKPTYPKDTVDAQLKALTADGWFMIDAETGLVLSSKNPDKRLYPASMTKMMTCILACESGRLSEIVTISAAAGAVPYGGVRKGEKYVLRDLLYRVMLPSDNGAAHAVGEFLANNDTLGFSNMMNKKAKELGMKHQDVVCALDAIVDPVSLNEPVYANGGDAIYVMDQVKDTRNTDESWLEQIALKEAMDKLSQREKDILSLRFFEGKTQMEVSARIGISQAQISRLEKHAINKIKQEL